jgi:hypothetical protein
MSARRFASRWRSRLNRLQDAWALQRDIWHIEHEIERAVSGDGRIIVGPWLSEVGHEVLYWVPFVRWVQAAYRIPADRLIVVSRGGVDSWYSDITSRYVEIFDLIEPSEFSAALARRVHSTGTSKQVFEGELDQRLIDQVCQDSEAAGARVLHPSVLYQLFAQFWSGHQSMAFLERHLRHKRLNSPDLDRDRLGLPERYVAVKCHTARSLRDAPTTRRLVSQFVSAVATRTPVVLLETGLTLDEHEDFPFETTPRIVRLRDRLDARTNLAVQTAIIAGATSYVGTCGGLAWAAPMLAVDTTALVSDARLLHAHLAVARRVYHRLGAGRFSTVDLSGLERLGIEPYFTAEGTPV